MVNMCAPTSCTSSSRRARAPLILWFSLHYVQQSFVIDEKSPDPGGLPYRWIIKGMMPIGFALLAVQGVACALAAAAQLRLAGRQD